jgi:S1-C subfamily serine protease
MRTLSPFLATLGLVLPVAAQGGLREVERDLKGAVDGLRPAMAVITSHAAVQGPSRANRYKTPLRQSGFILNAEGYVVTISAEPLRTARTITIELEGDRPPFRARFIGEDAESGISVLRLEAAPQPLVPLPLGNSDDLKPGSLVVILGYPYQLGLTTGVGIVSGVGRNFGDESRTRKGIQFGGVVNPGQPGGIIADASGKAVGVIAARYSPEDQPAPRSMVIVPSLAAEGINFAIPINQAKASAEYLIRRGPAFRAEDQEKRLGVIVETEPLEEALRSQLKLERGLGLLVHNVYAGSPAAKGGLRPYDVLLRFGDQELRGYNALVEAISKAARDQEITVEYIRGGERAETRVKFSK